MGRERKRLILRGSPKGSHLRMTAGTLHRNDDLHRIVNATRPIALRSIKSRIASA